MRIEGALAAFLLAWCLHAATASGAERPVENLPLLETLNESFVRIPVSVNLAGGGLAYGEMLLTIFRPAGPGPFPIAIINHGRNGDRRTPQRYRMMGMASYLVRRGFAVFVPTRLGYGASQLVAANGTPPDPEDSGDCHEKHYAQALVPAVRQIAATLAYARAQPYADPVRHIVIGLSVGGFATVAYSAANPVGLLGYVNFAGGAGGDPLTHPGTPCQPERIAQSFAEFGKTARAPSLWIYAENDQFFGPRFARAWHTAYTAGGAPAQFVQQAPFGKDGHTLMNSGLPVWRPLTDVFLQQLGVRETQPPKPPVASGYAPIQEVGRVPWLSLSGRDRGYAKFLLAPMPRAFALSEGGYWGWASGPEEPSATALAICNARSPQPCVLYAVDDVVVWPASPPTASPRMTDQALTNQHP